jgi:hypothetical protein
MAARTHYVLIETRDPFDSADVDSVFTLAGRLGDAADVSVYLVENAVLPARAASSAAARITSLAGRTTVLADDFSLRQRGIGVHELAPGVAPASIDRLVELITAPGSKAMWH